jgi:hypothetical protein
MGMQEGDKRCNIAKRSDSEKKQGSLPPIYLGK